MATIKTSKFIFDLYIIMTWLHFVWLRRPCDSGVARILPGVAFCLFLGGTSFPLSIWFTCLSMLIFFSRGTGNLWGHMPLHPPPLRSCCPALLVQIGKVCFVFYWVTKNENLDMTKLHSVVQCFVSSGTGSGICKSAHHIRDLKWALFLLMNNASIEGDLQSSLELLQAFYSWVT